MTRTNLTARRGGAATAVALGLLMLSGAALATEQAQERREGRDAKQEAKQEARAGKVDCKAADQ